MTSATPRGPKATPPSSAVGDRERITNLVTARGIATLGILVMNATAFALYACKLNSAPSSAESYEPPSPACPRVC